MRGPGATACLQAAICRKWESCDRENQQLDMKSTLELQQQLLAPADWRVLRAARLRALLDSPHAFTSNYALESNWGELEWRRVLTAATWVVAHEAGSVIGMAKAVIEPELPAARIVESAWVAPTHRRRGVLRALLQKLAETASVVQVTELMLWVLEDNHDAQNAYRALGFEPTGERQFLPTVGRFERRLVLRVRAVPEA
jgi:GNAT superfamily N-acetyltransferase